MWIGRQTDMTKLIVAINNFVNAPEKCFVYKRERKAIGKQLRVYGRQWQMEKLDCWTIHMKEETSQKQEEVEDEKTKNRMRTSLCSCWYNDNQ
jgi:hypothetical protein